MATAQEGNTVHVHYTGRLEDGTVFDSSQGGDPLSFLLGGGQVIPGFEEAVQGMETGSSTTVSIPPGEAYGTHRDDLVLEVGHETLPEGFTPEPGQQLQMTLADGKQVPVVVKSVGDETIKLDANHPLAGQTLVFDIELVACE